MIERYFHRQDALRRIQDNALGTDLEHFASYLTARGHTPKTIGLYMRAVTHFGRWLEQKQIDPRSINEDTVTVFLHRHLPECHCVPPAIRSLTDSRAALRLLLDALREGDLIPIPPPQEATAIDSEVREFEEHLRTTCGLADESVNCRIRHIRQFLVAKYGQSLPKLTELEPAGKRGQRPVP